MTTRAAGLVVVMLVMLVTPAAAQVVYRAAHGNTSLSPIRHGFLNVDVAEAKLGFTFIGVRQLRCHRAECVRELHFSAHGAAAGRKAEDNLFARIDFNLGFELAGRALVRFAGAGPMYHAVFVSIRSEIIERKIAEIGSDSTLTLDERNQRTFGLAVGYNVGSPTGTIVGIGVEGRRELSSPGFARRRSVCTPGFFPGSEIPLQNCRDRFVAPLADVWSGHIRADAAFKLARLGGGPTSPWAGLVTAASIDVLERASPAVNFAAGPTLSPPGYPGQLFLGVLFELRDAFDANGYAPQLRDRLLVRLVAGLPFKVLLSQ